MAATAAMFLSKSVFVKCTLEDTTEINPLLIPIPIKVTTKNAHEIIAKVEATKKFDKKIKGSQLYKEVIEPKLIKTLAAIDVGYQYNNVNVEENVKSLLDSRLAQTGEIGIFLTLLKQQFDELKLQFEVNM